MNYRARNIRAKDEFPGYNKPYRKNAEGRLQNKPGTNQMVMVRHCLPEKPQFNRTSVSTRYSHFHTSSLWGFNDPETKRKRRVAKYRSFAVKGKVKASISRGFRWIKNKYKQLVHRC